MTTHRPNRDGRIDVGERITEPADRSADSDRFTESDRSTASDHSETGDAEHRDCTATASDRIGTDANEDRNRSADRDRTGTDGNDDRDRTDTASAPTETDDTEDRNRTADRDRTAADDTEHRNRTATTNGDHTETDDSDDRDRSGDGDPNRTAGRGRSVATDGGGDDDDGGDDDATATTDATDATVTPYAVEGDVDYEELLERFGADPLTDAQVARFPEPRHPLLRRGVYYAGRDVDRFLDAGGAGDAVSVVTGVGPSGPMHLGHVTPFYFAKYLQEATGARVYVPVSDDEKYLLKRDLSMADVHRHTRENLRDLLAVGFDPDRTRFVVDTLDADVVYPQAVRFAKHVTQATMEATYGEPPNVGASFYPAVQTAHLLLPQLVHGRHPTLVPIAVDQDPHVRLCRDVAGRAEYDVDKPAALLGRFLPTLAGPGKMSTSDDPDTADDAPPIYLTDDRETVAEKVRRYAYSGGRESVAEHREHGGDPEVDVAFRYLRSFFEPDDEVLADLAEEYRSGELLSGALKDHAIERIGDFLAAHQRRRPEGDLREAVAPFRLTDGERARLRPDVLG